MNSVIEQMLTQHGSATMDDRKNSIKEVVQEILLCGLSRAGFFQSAAFYGGTALRLFYGLDRFSEDLDFSLVMSDSDFRLDTFLPFLEKELLAYGFHFQAESKNKAFASDIQSAFVKGGTREHILLCFADERLARTIGSSERIKINWKWIPHLRPLRILNGGTDCSLFRLRSICTICPRCSLVRSTR